MHLVLTLIERLQSADAARMEFASHDVVGRLVRRLLELSECFGEPTEDGVEVTLALSQEELAAWTAASREAVAKAIRLLRELGWIETRRRRVVIRDSMRCAATRPEQPSRDGSSRTAPRGCGPAAPSDRRRRTARARQCSRISRSSSRSSNPGSIPRSSMSALRASR